MKSNQIKYENISSFVRWLKLIQQEREELPSCDITFYLTWTNSSRDSIQEISESIEYFFPDSIFYGNEASGNISNGDLAQGVSVTCYQFEKEDTRAELVWVEQGTPCGSLRDLWTYCNSRKGLKGIELIPSITYLDTLQMDSSVPEIGEDILIFGGASVNYDNPSFEAEIIAKGHPLTKDGMAVVLYYGEQLNLSASYILGWKGLGRQMRVTQSHDKVISRIDDMPAFSVYENYLNLKADDKDNLVFPLIVEEDGVEYIRTPQVFLPDSSMRMFVNIAEGSLIRIAYGDKNTILSSLYEKASEIEVFHPEAIKAFSCAARRLFWGDDEVCKETLPLQDIAPVAGFYTGGEILRFGKKLRVLNSTLVLINLREGTCANLPEEEIRFEKTDKSLISRITFFAEKIVEEQETQQKELLRRNVLVNYFMKSYALAYYCNLLTGSVLALRAKAGFPGGDNEKANFSKEKLAYYVEKYVSSGDRERVNSSLDPDYIREQLQNCDDFSFVFRGGMWGNLTYRCTVIRGDDNDHVAIGFTNITDELRQQQEYQKQLQDALAMADSANRAKTEFLFNMSHDIRTPMNAITGFTNMAIKHIDDREKALDCLEKTKQSGNLLLSLINSVLEVSRIESGNATLDEQPGDVSYSFSSLESTLGEMAEAKGIDLSFEIGTIKDRFVYCDINRCNRIIVNIVTNSIKYTPEGGHVKAKCEQIGGALDGLGFYRYTFEDDGIGMSKEFQEHVFEQFSREKRVALSAIQGSGLGMAVVKSFVDLMNGTIDCQSELGKGTVFTVVLPFKIQKGTEYTDPYTREILTASSDIRSFDESDFCGKKVLLVEDNELNREIAADILEEKGLLVDEAFDGAAAVRKVEEKGPYYYDFILMDIQMPVMDGFEATKAIRKLYPENHIPIIALSANAFTEDRANSLEAGMDEHVSKPIVIPELFSCLAKFI